MLISLRYKHYSVSLIIGLIFVLIPLGFLHTSMDYYSGMLTLALVGSMIPNFIFMIMNGYMCYNHFTLFRVELEKNYKGYLLIILHYLSVIVMVIVSVYIAQKMIEYDLIRLVTGVW